MSMNDDEVKKILELVEKLKNFNGDSKKDSNRKKREEIIEGLKSIEEIEKEVGKPMPPILKANTIVLMNGLLKVVLEANHQDADIEKEMKNLTVGKAALMATEMDESVALALMATIEYWLALGKGLGLSEKESANLMVAYAQDCYAFYKAHGTDARIRGRALADWFEKLLNEHKFDDSKKIEPVDAVPDENKPDGYYQKD